MLSPAVSSRFIRVGHSPDPDDAFMFYALAKNRISMEGFRVEHVIEDIESLNQRALQAGDYRDVPPLEVTAVSCHAYAYLPDKYLVMRSGASVGDQYGPIVVTREDAAQESIAGKTVAIPGKLTTAYLVLQLFEKKFRPVFMPFDLVLEAVRSGRTDFGLVIHEGQITYREHGLRKVVDLGRWWHEQFNLPLPLGVDVIRRNLGEDTIRAFSRLFKSSIEYALAHRDEALEYALTFGRGVGRKRGDEFVAMYVNDRTVDLGEKGEAGFKRLLEAGYEKGLLPHRVIPEFAS